MTTGRTGRPTPAEARSRCLPIVAVALGFTALASLGVAADLREMQDRWGWTETFLMAGFFATAVWAGVSLTLSAINPQSYRGHREVYRVDRRIFFAWTRRLVLKLHAGILFVALFGGMLLGGVGIQIFRWITGASLEQVRASGWTGLVFGAAYLGVLGIFLRKMR